VSVIDLEATPPRIIDRVVVGDGPEGLAISPKGDVAVAVILAGSNMKNAYFYHRNGTLSVLQIDGKKVTLVGDIEVGVCRKGRRSRPTENICWSELSRPGRIDPQSRWRDHHEHRQTFQAAWPSASLGMSKQ